MLSVLRSLLGLPAVQVSTDWLYCGVLDPATSIEGAVTAQGSEKSTRTSSSASIYRLALL
jgi:hypothetical protein